MKKLSRWMPAAPVRKTPWWAWPLVVLIFPLLVVAICLGLAFFPIVWLFETKHRRQMRAWASQRSGESICTFVRQFDVRATDTWVLRAVYEEVSRDLEVAGRPFPLHAEDRWKEDLRIDDEDMEFYFLPNIAHRAGRSLEDTAKNPFYDRVQTIRDLVSFLQHQPPLPNVEPLGAATAD